MTRLATCFSRSVIAFVLLCLAFPAALVSAPAASAAQNPTATFTPAELQMSLGRTRETALLVSNQTDRVVSDMRVSFRLDPGVEAIPTAKPQGLAAGSQAAIPVTVSRTTEAPASASVVAIVEYTIGTGGDAAASTTVATLTVNASAAAAVRSAEVTVTPAAGSEKLIQYQETDLFFTIANPGDSPQVVDPVVVSYPDYLSVSYMPEDGDPVTGAAGNLELEDFATLEPGNATVLHLDVAADQPLQPGAALFHITARASDSSDGSVGTAVSSQKITLEVLGESGVLTLLGVPALLFVPGLVWILVLWALWKFVSPRREFALATPPGGSLVEGKVALWVFALLPSLLFPFIYPWVTGLFGPERDYRKAYGLDDILYVWIMAAAAAALVWAVTVITARTFRRLFVPAEGDKPLELVRKYAHRPWKNTLPGSGAMFNGSQRVVALTGRRKDEVLVTPVIRCQTGGLSDSDREKFEQLRSDKPSQLVRLFKRQPGLLSYAPGGPLPGPTVVATDKLSDQHDVRLWEPDLAPALGRLHDAGGEEDQT